MDAVIDRPGPFWIATQRQGKIEQWAQPFGARNHEDARSMLATLGLPNADLLGPYARRSDAVTALDKWLENGPT